MPQATVERIDHGDIRELKLARPPANALDPVLCAALRTELAQAGADGVGGIVLSGGEGIFSGGLDVPYLLSLDDDADVRAAWLGFLDLARAIATSPVPVTAAVTGHSPAGGCVLALCCDYRVMAEGPFVIGLNEVQVGLVAPEGIQRLLRRAVGARQAERLLVAGAMVDAAQAQRIGLVDELAAPADVVARARAWLESLLQLPRQPMLATRAIARADLVAAVAPEWIDVDHFIASWRDPDTRGALQALAARLRR
ncbi:enoyl-CoA hydratase/isomerase family protein [Luteimonas sp. BDR2-5]|uniref:enoyl-CoA hydratase/isomerase family protein n=1 Tax=Proluteimonas luteida TaxID=2878685 RepID=UPI001E57459D|nr:enoyl-CoA hydratase/isomerase family protein [Luteimonas sp. BDR2-5]MCD9028315.1 enoyl-CoA hydratase/isomerase family protein [Luteimonas sp. BDR2-5]